MSDIGDTIFAVCMAPILTPDQMATLLAKQQRQITRMTSALNECAEYFEPRQDADHDGDHFIANEEMRLLIEVNEALGKGGY